MGFFKDLVKKGAGVVGAAVGFVASGFNPAGAAAGWAAGSAIGDAVAGAEAQKKQKKASDAKRKAADLQTFQQRIKLIKDYQVAQATSLANWQGSGAGLESSGAMGTAASLGAQSSYNLTLLSHGARYADRFYENTKDANKIMSQQAIVSGLNQAGTSLLLTMGSGGGPPEQGSPAAIDQTAMQVDRAGFGQTGGSGGALIWPGE